MDQDEQKLHYHLHLYRVCNSMIKRIKVKPGMFPKSITLAQLEERALEEYREMLLHIPVSHLMEIHQLKTQLNLSDYDR